MHIRTEFPHRTRREDVRIPLSDGTLLYARLWRPVTDEPVPALLEYAPHRLTDGTAPRDWQRHPWYAGHGYASVRVDVRGYGCSEGLPGDPYDATEVADGVEVVGWLARQPWCTGKVGMFGIAWGGCAALQIAALAPEPLKAVVTVCSSDDRYDNDVHYLGGSVLAVDTHAWAATLLALVARPPDPAFIGEKWREMWLERLESVRPFIHTWLAHQTRDAYWEQGSVPEDYGAIGAAVLAVGGWHDPHRDTVLRLVEHLPTDRVRGLIGPWSHQYPDRGLSPGPAIGFLQETLRWWDQHLKGEETGVMKEPPLRSWIGQSHPPATAYAELPGRWVGDPAWPSPHITPVAYALSGAPVRVRSPQHTGLDAGRFVPFGGAADLPPDQRAEDAHSAAFDFPVPEGPGPLEILGRPVVTLRLRMDVPFGQAIARLCDVAPDGSSTLVTRGALNLSSRHGRDRADAWPLGATQDVTFALSGIGHAFSPGHRVRLAVSSAYWPWIWPQADSVGFTLDPAGSSLQLPVREHTSDDTIAFADPEQSKPLGVSFPAPLDEPRPERLVVRDVAKGEWRLEVGPRPGGTRVHPDGLECVEDARETYVIESDDPLSARTCSTWHVQLHRPELGWDVSVDTRSEISCDAADFVMADEVVCREGDEVVFHRTWHHRLPRTAG
ncbi:CocE/NonD family hydrolase [Streptomyces sp. NPDC006711]|uniref:CocE/NonD family hydrolase n=1 Tax=Streptomyces sp. NPDC006711 TaxID=3364762 RepID=UPI0036986A51